MEFLISVCLEFSEIEKKVKSVLFLVDRLKTQLFAPILQQNFAKSTKFVKKNFWRLYTAMVRQKKNATCPLREVNRLSSASLERLTFDVFSVHSQLSARTARGLSLVAQLFISKVKHNSLKIRWAFFCLAPTYTHSGKTGGAADLAQRKTSRRRTAR